MAQRALKHQKGKKIVSNREIQKIEAELQHSRAMLSGRWSALELELAGIANSAKEDVSETLQNAKEAVSIHHQVSKRPWSMLAASLLVGVGLSKIVGLRSLAVVGLTSPFLKDAFTSATMSTTSGLPVSPLSKMSEKSESPKDSETGFMDGIRIQTITSLANIARDLVKRNVPSPFVSIIEQAIAKSTNSLLTPKVTKTNTLMTKERVMSVKDENPSLH